MPTSNRRSKRTRSTSASGRNSGNDAADSNADGGGAADDSGRSGGDGGSGRSGGNAAEGSGRAVRSAASLGWTFDSGSTAGASGAAGAASRGTSGSRAAGSTARSSSTSRASSSSRAASSPRRSSSDARRSASTGRSGRAASSAPSPRRSIAAARAANSVPTAPSGLSQRLGLRTGPSSLRDVLNSGSVTISNDVSDGAVVTAVGSSGSAGVVGPRRKKRKTSRGSADGADNAREGAASATGGAGESAARSSSAPKRPSKKPKKSSRKNSGDPLQSLPDMPTSSSHSNRSNSSDRLTGMGRAAALTRATAEEMTARIGSLSRSRSNTANTTSNATNASHSATNPISLLETLDTATNAMATANSNTTSSTNPTNPTSTTNPTIPTSLTNLTNPSQFPTLTTPSLLSSLLLEIQCLSQDRKRCTSALLAMKEGRMALPLREDALANLAHLPHLNGAASAGSVEDALNILDTSAMSTLEKSAKSEAGETKASKLMKSTQAADGKSAKSKVRFSEESELGGKGKRRGKKKDVSSDNPGDGGNGIGDNGEMESSPSRDAHLIMAVTQACNVLISYLTNTANDGSGKDEEDEELDSKIPTTEHSQHHPHERKQAAIILSSLSYYLISALVANRNLLETLTASSGSGSITTTTTPIGTSTITTNVAAAPSTSGAAPSTFNTSNTSGTSNTTTAASAAASEAMSHLQALFGMGSIDGMGGIDGIGAVNGVGGTGGIGGVGGVEGAGSTVGLLNSTSGVPIGLGALRDRSADTPSGDGGAGSGSGGTQDMEVDVIDVDARAASAASGSAATAGASGDSVDPTSPRALTQEELEMAMGKRAKEVLGRALISGVLGALWSMETLSKVVTSDAIVDDVGSKSIQSAKAAKEADATTATKSNNATLIRRAMWTSLIAMETSFQMTSTPKLLQVSAVVTPSSGKGGSGVGGGSYGGGMGGMGGLGGLGGIPTLMDFDGMMSAVSAAMIGGIGVGMPSSTSGTSFGTMGGMGGIDLDYSDMNSTHVHDAMGANAIAMWNKLLQRIMMDYELGFQSEVVKEEGDSGLGSSIVQREQENEALAQVCEQVTHQLFTQDVNSKFVSLVLSSPRTGGNHIFRLFLGPPDQPSQSHPSSSEQSLSSKQAQQSQEAQTQPSQKQPPPEPPQPVKTMRRSARKAKLQEKERQEKQSLALQQLQQLREKQQELKELQKKLILKKQQEQEQQDRLYLQLSLLLGSRPENHVTFETHVSIRRWAALAFGWLCEGQKRLLEVCSAVLENENNGDDVGTVGSGRSVWGEVMVLGSADGGEGASDVAGAAGVTNVVDLTSASEPAKKKKKKGSSKNAPSEKISPSKSSKSQELNQHKTLEPGESIDKEGIPGSLALIVFVSCVIDMVYDAGASSGLAPPSSGWIDEYVNVVTELREPQVPQEPQEEQDLEAASAKQEVSAGDSTASSSPTGNMGKIEEGRRRSARARSKNPNNIPATTAGDSHVTGVGGTGDTGSTPKKPPSSNPVWLRPDIRNPSAILTQHLITAHTDCLEECFRVELLRPNPAVPLSQREKESKRLIINDDEIINSFAFYPYIHRTLETLAKIASSSSLFASSDVKIFLGFGAATSLNILRQRYASYLERDDGLIVMDSKLYSMILKQITDCLESDAFNTSTSDGSSSSSSVGGGNQANQFNAAELPLGVINRYCLNDPFEINDANSNECSLLFNSQGTLFASEMDTSNSVDLDSGFRFRRHPSRRTNAAEILSLLIRVSLQSDGSNNSYSVGMSNLLKSLFALIHLCYDFHIDLKLLESGEEEVSQRKKRASGGKKKRKTDFTTIFEGRLGAKSSAESNVESKVWKTFTRCALGSDTLKCLKQFFKPLAPRNPILNDAISSAFHIRSCLRATFSVDLALDFVKLGYSLEDRFIYPRLLHFMSEYRSADQKGEIDCTSSMLESSNVFKPWERYLWSSHVQLAVTIGQGESDFLPQKKSSLLHDSEARLKVFQRIVADRKEGQIDPSEKTSNADSVVNGDRWPLCLRSVQHSLVSSTLSAIKEPSSNQDARAELYLCNSFLNSVEDFVGNLLKLPTTESFFSRKSSVDDAAVLVVSDNILVSFQDARLFTLAFGKLPLGLQKPVLSRLIKILHDGMHTAKNESSAHTTASKRAEASHFMARVITLCASLVDVITAPSILLKQLAESAGSTHYGIPKIKRVEKLDVETGHLGKEFCFQSLFDDVNPSTFRDAHVSLLESDTETLEEALKSSLAVGFTSASIDGCHLLFSAWNAAKPTLRAPTSWKTTPASTIMQMSFVERILKLREDMWQVYKLVRKRSRESRPSTEVKVLQSALKLSEEITAQTSIEINRLVPTSAHPSLPAFAFYEALPMYTSFLTSLYTKPLSLPPRGSKVPREKSSSDDDSNDDEAGREGNEDDLRLHEACQKVGAAPIHPDWLSDVKLIDGIHTSTLVRTSEEALQVCLDLGTSVLFQCYLPAIERALQGKSPTLSSLAIKLTFSQRREVLDNFSDSQLRNISTLCQVNNSVLKLVSDKGDYCDVSTITNLTTCSQIMDVVGTEDWDAAPGEHRANGQWESLLNETLQGASLKMADSVLETIESDPNTMKELIDNLEAVTRWRRVLTSLVGGMVPIAALLHYGIKGGKQQLHPANNLSTAKRSYLGDTEVRTSYYSGDDSVGSTVKKVLSFLSHVSACMPQDEDICNTSRAIAAHLFQNSSEESFNSMISLTVEKIKFESIGAIVHQMLTVENNSDSLSEAQRSAACAIVTKMITGRGSCDVSRLLAFFGTKSVLTGRLICDNRLTDLTDILRTLNIGTTNSWVSARADIARLLLVILCQGAEFGLVVRVFVSKLLIDLIDAEYMIAKGKFPRGEMIVRKAAASAFDELSKNIDSSLLVQEICSDDMLGENLSRVLSYLAIESDEGCRKILQEMLGCLDQWACSSSQKRAMNLVCLLASSFGALQDVGLNILLLVEKASSDNLALVYVDAVRNFFEFIVALDQHVNSPTSNLLEKPRDTSGKGDAFVSLKSGDKISRTCSFVETGEGFTEQHWYNCYTCGLLWDKGCCSLCARVCHAGHDVGYSRKSSFFCDCGAESGVDKNRLPCKCLQPVPEETILRLYESCSPTNEKAGAKSESDAKNFTDMVIHSGSSLEASKHSLSVFIEKARESGWNKKIQNLFKLCYENMPPQRTDFSLLLGNTSSSPEIGEAPKLEIRSGIPLKLKSLDSNQKKSIRRVKDCNRKLTASTSNIYAELKLHAQSKSNALQLRMTSSPTASHIRKAGSSASSQLMASDDRGRLIVAESSSLLFCTLANVKDTERSQFSRANLGIRSKESVKFNVNGISLNSSNQRHLVVWGASEACVVILKPSGDAIESTVDLKLQLSDIPSEYLLKCEWVPGSELMVVAICGTVVHVFDLKRAEANICKASTHYALAYEDVLIRSAVMTRQRDTEDCGNGIRTKLFLLLDSGRLHPIDLAIDEVGDLLDQGENYIECGSGTSFPTEGIRRYCGGDPISVGSTATTMGEGISLHYLSASNLLLYQTVSSCCIAFTLDDNGTISGSFELLPHLIGSDEIGSQSLTVSGPFAHFQELGVVCKNEEMYYRMSCVGRSTRSNTPKIVEVLFNENSVEYVKELSTMGHILSSVVGSVAFSTPRLFQVSDKSQIFENAFMAVLCSNGSLFLYGEDLETSLQSESGKIAYAKPKNLTFFEDLINVNLSDIQLGGDFAGRDAQKAKAKLSLSNNDFVIGPRDGSTLTVSLQPDDSSPSIDLGTGVASKIRNKKKDENNSLAIVAVRLLVGSMSELIPRKISVMGRSVELKKNVKRWYDFVLSDEEILVAVRNGFVSILISSSHDSMSGSLIDSIEVYARRRDELPFLSYRSGRSSATEDNDLNYHTPWDKNVSPIFISCIETLGFLKHLGCLKMNLCSRDLDADSSPESESILKIMENIIEETALDPFNEPSLLRKHAVDFVKTDSSKQCLSVDKGTLLGSMKILRCLHEYVKRELSSVSILGSGSNQMIGNTTAILIRILNNVISICRGNPSNYMNAIAQLVEEKQIAASLSIEAKAIIDLLQNLKTIGAKASSFVKPVDLATTLILQEAQLCKSNEPTCCGLARFTSLSDYLCSDSPEIVESCCSAIRNAMTTPETKTIAAHPPLTPEKIDDNHLVTYQCDSCKIFPITGRRYTLGGENDVDLCKTCYDLGMEYASTHDNNEILRIQGRTLCIEDEEMTCEKIWQMTSKEELDPSLQQEVLRVSEAAKIPARVRSSTVPTINSRNDDGILVSLLDLIGSLFQSDGPPPSLFLLQLVMDIILSSPNQEALGFQMISSFTKNISNLIESCQICESDLSAKSVRKLVICLRTLAGLVTQDRGMNFGNPPTFPSSTERKDKTDPRYVCEVHGVPAVRRRCSHGVNKNRRFYVCGLERKHRCSYLKWVEDEDTHKPDFFHDDRNISVPFQAELMKTFGEKVTFPFSNVNSIQEHLCKLMGTLIQKQEFSPLLAHASTETNTDARFPSLRNEEDEARDENDGVFHGREKISRKPNRLPQPSDSNSSPFDVSSKESLICAILDLMSLIAPANNSWDNRWFSVLCETLSSTNIPVTLRSLAKKMLQKLCGGRRELYHRVRDHYVFGFQFRKLLQQCEPLLDTALCIREQARQCGPNWRGEDLSFKTLSSAGLLGVASLISEDCFTVAVEDPKMIDELLEVAQGNNNWRQFCGLSQISGAVKGSLTDTSKTDNLLEQIYQRSPVCSLMWLACVLRGSNLTKILTLLYTALGEDTQNEDICASGTEEDDIQVEGYSTQSSQHSDPESSLLSMMNMSADLHAFVVQFVLHGDSSELRSVACNVAQKLALRMPQAERCSLVGGLIDGPLREVAPLGCMANEFFNFLQKSVQTFGDGTNTSRILMTNAASCLMNAFLAQHHRCGNKNSSISEVDASVPTFDLSDCVHCHRQSSTKKILNGAKSESQPSAESKSADDKNDCLILSEQVRPFHKTQLEKSTAASVSTEFASFVQLKCRVALQSVSLTVSDARGRLVKKVGIYFSPRQVSDVNDLKSDRYTHLWQQCGTISLARGSTQASLKLKCPVIAANLKFEYVEFYEKLGGMRASDGSLILHCPRCTRAVNNAHGVCGNCGEVAFQCRKCRHINYSCLDAFLCTECGYCASGSFQYELSVGIALNAVAIINEKGFLRSMAMLRIASKRHAELQNTLKKKLEQHTNQHIGDGETDDMILFGPILKRALFGGFPATIGSNNDGDEGNGKPKPSPGSSHHSDTGGRLSAASKARSLLTLARQLQAESMAFGGDSERGSRGDFLVRQALLNAGSSAGSSGIDFLEDADESLLHALSGAPGDPLSRIVANIHARVRSAALGGDGTRSDGRNSRNGGGDDGDDGNGNKSGTGNGKKDDKSKMSLAEECSRLYSQMREAERECYELNKRLDAWNRLNRDALAVHGPRNPFYDTPFCYVPTPCAVCGTQLTYYILSLLHAVFITDISHSEHCINRDVIKILLKEPKGSCPQLLELKRRVIITLASTSSTISELVLKELEMRLVAVQDETSAAILGELAELANSDFSGVDLSSYLDLAISTLNGNM